MFLLCTFKGSQAASLSLYISEMARVLRVARSSSSLFSFGSRSYSAEASHVSSPPPPFLGARRDVTKERNVQWVFLGCPGVGKGTYASRLSSLLGVPHIATGDLVRDALASSGPLSQQVLVSLYVQMNPKTTSFFCLDLLKVHVSTNRSNELVFVS